MSRIFFLLPLFLLCLSVAAQGEDLPRQPSLDDTVTYLRSHLDAPQGFISYFFPDEANALTYLDVNGDGEDDLIVTGWLFVAVLLWQGEGYGEPFQLIETALPDSGTWSHVSFQDWTLDNIPEIVFELRQPKEGQESGGNSFRRSLIRCTSHCRLIWQEKTGDFFWAGGRIAGIYLYQTEMNSFREESGQVWLDLISEDFAFNCRLAVCRVNHELPAPDSFYPSSRVGAKLRTRYRWDGLQFNRDDSLVLVESYPLPSQSQLSAMSGDSSARIEVGELCQVVWNEIPLGEMFPCLADFTRLSWRDMTGDGMAELVLEYAYLDTEWLIIYRDEQELARFSGAIRAPDLFGIRILDDGILSAGERYTHACEGDFCWYALNQANRFYQWDGAQWTLRQ